MRYLRRFFSKKPKPKPRDPDPLVGRFFLSVSHCIDCHAVRLNSKGLVLERIPDAWAYVVKFYSWGEESRGSRFSMVVPGWNTADWSFYASMADLMMDEREILAQSHHPAQHTEQVN